MQVGVTSNFFRGTTRGIRIASGGLAIAGIGAVMALLGTFVGQRWLHYAAFGIGCAGILVALGGIADHWYEFFFRRRP